MSEGIPAAATGIGSMPGTSVVEACAVVVGEVPDWPFLPELPARGAGADMVGRTAAALVGIDASFALEAVPSGWLRNGRPGPDMRRATSWLGEDLDRFEEALVGFSGPVKLQLCGPWTWAAAVEDGSGRRLVRDRAFTAELAEVIGLAAADLVAQVRRRVPGATVCIQVDEPGVPAVLAGALPTASGLGRLSAVAEPEVVAGLAKVRAAATAPAILHCCATGHFDVARAAEFAAVSWDATLPGEAEAAAAAFEAGVTLLPGVVPAVAPTTVAGAWQTLREWWRRTGLSPAAAHQLACTPTCGLAAATPAGARRALGVTQQLRARLSEWDGS